MIHPDDLVGQSDLFERPQDTQIASVAARSFVHSSKAIELEHTRSLPRSFAGVPTRSRAVDLSWIQRSSRLLARNRVRSLAEKKGIAVVDPAVRRSSLGYTDGVIRRHAMKVMMFGKATK